MRVQDEEKVNCMVQQWLQERGFVRALQALREESFVEAPEDAAGGQVSCTPACALVHVCRAEWTECARCSLLHDPFRMQLSAIIYEHWEMKQALELGGVKPLDADCREAEEQLLELPAELPFPSEHAHTIANVHTGNIIACKFNNDGTLIATGSSDRSVRVLDSATRAPLRQLALHSAPVLCVAFSPTRSTLLLSAAMDGSVVLSDASTGEVAHECMSHSKYVHRAVWSRCGGFFATLGHDKCIFVYKISEELEEKGREAQPVLVRKKDFVNIPEAACFLHDSATLVVAVRGDNYFHYLDIGSGEVLRRHMMHVQDHLRLLTKMQSV